LQSVMMEPVRQKTSLRLMTWVVLDNKRHSSLTQMATQSSPTMIEPMEISSLQSVRMQLVWQKTSLRLMIRVMLDSSRHSSLTQMATQSSPTMMIPIKISSLQRFVSIKVSAWFKWQDEFWVSMWFVILCFVEDCLGKWMEHCRQAAVRTCQCLFYYSMLQVYLLKNVWQLILLVFIKASS
jgi:hypothetical protein